MEMRVKEKMSGGCRANTEGKWMSSGVSSLRTNVKDDGNRREEWIVKMGLWG
jgi:hypothetical protein